MLTMISFAFVALALIVTTVHADEGYVNSITSCRLNTTDKTLSCVNFDTSLSTHRDVRSVITCEDRICALFNHDKRKMVCSGRVYAYNDGSFINPLTPHSERKGETKSIAKSERRIFHEYSFTLDRIDIDVLTVFEFNVQSVTCENQPFKTCVNDDDVCFGNIDPEKMLNGPGSFGLWVGIVYLTNFIIFGVCLVVVTITLQNSLFAPGVFISVSIPLSFTVNIGLLIFPIKAIPVTKMLMAELGIISGYVLTLFTLPCIFSGIYDYLLPKMQTVSNKIQPENNPQEGSDDNY